MCIRDRAEAVILKGIGHVIGGIAGRIMRDGLDSVILIGIAVAIGLAVRCGLHGSDSLRRIVGIVDGLTVGVRYPRQRAGNRVDNPGYNVAARILGSRSVEMCIRDSL